MTFLIIHGIGGEAGIHWQKWLHDNLAKAGHTVIMPSLSEPNRPDRATWLAEITALAKDVPSEELIIVGHSLGVTAALDYISSLSTKLHGLISVSGISEDYGVELNGYYLMERTIDFAKVKSHVDNIKVFYGDNDPYVPQETLQKVADGLEIKSRIIKNGGHLNTEAGFNTFPELLNTCIAFAKS
ncbi:serine hydrolase family protein [Candidatus Woesebacteria bacterium]|nr:serine hydrolase family protein [Candidatus Woesebacteria bacterium]